MCIHTIMRNGHSLLSASTYSYLLGGAFILLASSLYPHAALGKTIESERCSRATAEVERSLHLPDGFLSAMSRVETGRQDVDGTLAPWPWTVNAAGVGYQYHSLQEATEAVKDFQQKGIRSIDVGCMQVNIMHHPDAFSSLEAAFDPYTNAAFAGRFLKQMYDKTGSWPRAASAYHSQTPEIGKPYLWKVLEEWGVPQDEKRSSSTSLPSPALANIHPLVHHNVAPPNVMQRVTTPHPAIREFRPFTGNKHFSEPPAAHHRIDTSQKGRTLASYRAMPVRIISPAPQPSPY